MIDQCFNCMIERFETADLISTVINLENLVIININHLGI